MFFIITVALLCIGVILLRKNKDFWGYAAIVAGWATAVVSDIIFSQQWDRGFIPFFLGLIFIAYVQKKMNNNKSNGILKKK